jgi:signal transduction histidine kinase/ActR/RegA family two-component response regulator
MTVAKASAPPRRTLRGKLLAIVMIATNAALLFSAVSLLAYEIRSYRHAASAEVKSQADLLSQSIIPAIEFNDAKAATDALAALKARPDVEYAAAFLTDGSLFAQYQSEDIPPAAPEVAVAPALSGLNVSGRNIELAQPIVANGERLGTLYLRSRHELAPRIGGYFLILLATSAAGAALAWLIYRRMHSTITAPILAVTSAAERVMSERDFNLRVTQTSNDEVGTLVMAFNSMLDQLSMEMRERQAAEAALRDADRRKDEFLATLAHELRNPLAPIRNGLEILRQADDNPQTRRRAREIMERQLAHMVRLIDDLLDVSRITRGKFELRVETADMVAIVQGAMDAAAAELQAKQHAVSVELPSHPLWVHVDAARMTQVLVNLLTNAAKYTPASGRVCVRACEREGDVIVEVQDNGVGIDVQDQQRIFDMFSQVDRSLERGFTGLGIGLTIARQLVQMHGGMLTVASGGLGLGSTFSVKLALAQPPAQASPAPQQSAIENRQDGPLDVLIADDNHDFADSLAALLQQEGHQTRVFHDGSTALSAASAQPPDVAFVDIGMPGLNGYRFAEELRQHGSGRTPVLIAVTGWAQEADKLRARDAGFDHHWVKPLDLDRAITFLRTVQGERASGNTSPHRVSEVPSAQAGGTGLE